MKHSNKAVNTVFVFDWDGVIFNSKLQFKHSITSYLSQGGNYDEFHELYKQSWDQQGYNPFNFAKKLSKVLNRPYLDIYLELMMNLDQAKEYLFSDAVTFINQLKRQSHKIQILTSGNRHFQELKIIKSGLADHFNQATFVPDTPGSSNKPKKLHEIAQQTEQVIFFDDNPIHIEASKAVGKVKPILVERSDSHSFNFSLALPK